MIEAPIEEVNLDEISVITNFELLEHLFWPKDFLQACHRALPEGGLLILTTPNIKGFDLLVLGGCLITLVAPTILIISILNLSAIFCSVADLK